MLLKLGRWYAVAKCLPLISRYEGTFNIYTACILKVQLIMGKLDSCDKELNSLDYPVIKSI